MGLSSNHHSLSCASPASLTRPPGWRKISCESSFIVTHDDGVAGQGESRRFRFLYASAVLMAMLLPHAAQAGEDGVVHFDIPRQGADQALIEFAEQADVTFIFPAVLARELTANAVRGEFTPQEAMTRLLQGTGLKPGFNASGALTVKADNNLTEGNTVKRRGLLAAVIAALTGGTAGHANAQQSVEAQPVRAPLEEIVVTGSRLRASESDGPSLMTVFDRKKIEALGVSSVSQVLQYLPQAPYVFSENRQVGGAQFAELRGLGVDSTLVLINGRRTVPSSANVAVNAFDLNSIPLVAVERVEVLADSASAVYGADAVGGVINVVMKRDIPRPMLDFSIGTAAGGGREERASLAMGYTGDRLHASIVADYFDRDYLLGAERERSRDLDYTRYGSVDYRTPSTNPANITSRTTANLPGLPSRIAAVPDGSTGVGLTPQDFLATAGQSNLDSLESAYTSIVSDSERRSAMLMGDYAFTPRVSAFAEAMLVDRVTRTQFGPASLSRTRVPASNAFNPFGVDVSASYRFTGLGPRVWVVESSLRRGVLGLKGTAGRWDWEVAGLYSNEDSSSWNDNAVDLARVAASLASSDPALALNVFQDGPGGSKALLESLVTRRVSPIESEGKQVSAFARGPLFTVPAGELQVAVGGESRREAIDLATFVNNNTTSLMVQYARKVAALFAEARLPLVSAQWQWPLMQSLTLTLAGRHDDYDDFGTTFNPQYRLQWKLDAAWAVSASYGTSFRAPALFELYAPRYQTAGATVTDPRRNGETVSVNRLSGGNPDLAAVEAESWNTGIVFTPASLPGWRFTGTYWHTSMDGRVSQFDQQLLLANEALFPERVIRQAPTPADIAAGLPGVVTTVDTSRINFGTLLTDGVDVAAAGAFDTRYGTFGVGLTGTWVGRYSAVLVPSTPAVDRVGIASLIGTISRWRAVANLHWSSGGWNASATVRYVPTYEDRTVFDTDPDRRVGSQALLDLQGSLDVAKAWGTGTWASGLKLTVGVQNVLDKAPPLCRDRLLPRLRS